MSGTRVLYGVMLRRFVLALVLAILPLLSALASGVAAPAVAAPTATPSAPSGQVHDGGTIEGRVTAINYQRSVLGIDAGSRGHIDVSVMPSTSIQGKDSAYHAFTDLKMGQRLQIFSSIADGKYVAQIIRIR